MRVTNNHLYNQSLHSLNRANERNLTVSEKLAAQTNIIRPSDDPSGAAQVMRYESSNQKLAQYSENMTFAKNSLEYEEVALDSFGTMLNEANVLFLQAENSAQTQSDLDAIVNELSLMMESAVDLMNSQDASGKYIFAGASNDSPAFQRFYWPLCLRW
jgi:flagellar hook-associated protein 3 FlgL